MPNPKETKRIQCVKCNICVNRMRRLLVTKLDTRVASVISDWISPITITDEDYVCEKCGYLAMQAVQNLKDTSESKVVLPQDSSSRAVCILCGKSLLRNRLSYLIVRDNPTEVMTKIFNNIEARYAPRQVKPSDRVCKACWMKSKRSALRFHKIPQTAKTGAPDSQTPDQFEVTVKLETDPIQEGDQKAEKLIQEDPTELQEDPVVEAATANNPDEFDGTIKLPNYRRAPNSSRRCVFQGCKNGQVTRIPDNIRASLLNQHRFYIPKSARACESHKQTNEWESLCKAENRINIFTVHQIEHIFSFVSGSKISLDFSDLETLSEIDSDLFFYWLGISKENFLTVYNAVPRLQEMHRGVLGLAALLIKARTGDSDERLAVLLKISRSTLVRIMRTVQEIFLQDFDPNSVDTDVNKAVASA